MVGPTPEGLVIIPSRHSFDDLLSRTEEVVKARGMTLFACFDHSASAKAVGMAMPSLTVLVFGDPHAGTQLMLVQPAIGIELPLKLLVWRDESGAMRVAYTDPQWLAVRYGIAESPVVAKMATMLAALVQEIA